MAKAIVLKKNRYLDSMVLMQISHKAAEAPGVERVALMMGTDTNKPYLVDSGFSGIEMEKACADDLIIGVLAKSEEQLSEALTLIENLLSGTVRGTRTGRKFAGLEAAHRAMPDANVALISVPGTFAAREARKALLRGLHVFMFSDNVPIEEEVELKRLAVERKLLLMGPDCGTAILNGAGLGFANAVKPGPVGIIGASGTGIQEVCALLERFGGVGVSHAIGTGGRDLSEPVGGMTTLQGIEFLERDDSTRCLMVISKPPSARVAEVVTARLLASSKPAVACFLGMDVPSKQDGRLVFAADLEEAARAAIVLCGGEPKTDLDGEEGRGSGERRELSGKQRFVRGVYSGGSLCYEAMAYLRRHLASLHSNAAITGVARLADSTASTHNSLIDMGADEFTRGRVHPMLDPSAIAKRIAAEAQDPEVAVVLFDVILGHGVHPDPASVLASAVTASREELRTIGRRVVYLAHVCGTAGDPQGRDKQEATLRESGVVVLPTNAAMARMALWIVRRD